jgi:hypothetical protein
LNSSETNISPILKLHHTAADCNALATTRHHVVIEQIWRELALPRRGGDDRFQSAQEGIAKVTSIPELSWRIRCSVTFDLRASPTSNVA